MEIHCERTLVLERKCTNGITLLEDSRIHMKRNRTNGRTLSEDSRIRTGEKPYKWENIHCQRTQEYVLERNRTIGRTLRVEFYDVISEYLLERTHLNVTLVIRNIRRVDNYFVI